MGSDIGAHVIPDSCLYRLKIALFSRRHFHFPPLFTGVIGSQKMFSPVFDPLHRTAQAEGQKRNQKIFRVKLSPHPEAPSHVRFDEVDSVFRQPQKRGQHRAIEVRNLGGSPNRQDFCAPIVLRNQSPRLHRHAGVPLDRELLREGQPGPSEGPLHVAQIDYPVAGQIARSLLVNPHGICLHRAPRIHDRRKGLIVGLNGLQRVLRHVPAVGNHNGHRLSYVSNLLFGQGILEIWNEGRMDLQAHGDGFCQMSNVVERDDAQYSGNPECFPGVHRSNPGVRVGTPQQGRMRHPVEPNVIHVVAFPAQEAGVFFSLDPLADESPSAHHDASPSALFPALKFSRRVSRMLGDGMGNFVKVPTKGVNA